MTRAGLLEVLEGGTFTFKDELLLFVRSRKDIESLRGLIQVYKEKLSDYYRIGRDDPTQQQMILTTLTELQTLLASWRR